MSSRRFAAIGRAAAYPVLVDYDGMLYGAGTYDGLPTTKPPVLYKRPFRSLVLCGWLERIPGDPRSWRVSEAGQRALVLSLLSG